MANAARAAVHQHLLSGLHVRAVDEALPGGDHDQRQRRGLAHRQVGRLARQQVGVDRGVLRERALQAGHAAGQAVDLVADAKALDAGADGAHDAGQVHAEDGRQRMAGMRRGAGADLGVERVDAAGGDLDQHLAGPGDRARDLARDEGRVGGFEDKGVHRGGGHGEILSVGDVVIVRSSRLHVN